MAGRCGSPPTARSAGETTETFPASTPAARRGSAAVLEVGVDGETIARLLARDAENAAAVHAMIEARAAAEAASTDDDAAGAENVGQRGSFSGLRV